MLVSHLSVAAVIAAIAPRRHAILAWVPVWAPHTWLVFAAAISTAILGSWLAVVHVAPGYAAALSRESGPVEPLQAGFYFIAAWLAWQCAWRGKTPGERRLYRVASGACIALMLEEIEYFGLIETFVGGRIEGVWVRSLHDLIGLGMRVRGVHIALVAAAVVAAAIVVAWIGPRAIVAEITSARSLVTGAAGGALALSQVLDQNGRALTRVLGPMTTRLEEPLELIASVLLTTAVVMKLASLAQRSAMTPSTAGVVSARPAR